MQIYLHMYIFFCTFAAKFAMCVRVHVYQARYTHYVYAYM